MSKADGHESSDRGDLLLPVMSETGTERRVDGAVAGPLGGALSRVEALLPSLCDDLARPRTGRVTDDTRAIQAAFIRRHPDIPDEPMMEREKDKLQAV